MNAEYYAGVAAELEQVIKETASEPEHEKRDLVRYYVRRAQDLLKQYSALLARQEEQRAQGSTAAEQDAEEKLRARAGRSANE
jgi:hypothetical protein